MTRLAKFQTKLFLKPKKGDQTDRSNFKDRVNWAITGTMVSLKGVYSSGQLHGYWFKMTLDAKMDGRVGPKGHYCIVVIYCEDKAIFDDSLSIFHEFCKEYIILNVESMPMQDPSPG